MANANLLPRHEEAAALAVKFVKLLIAQTEQDSCGDPLKVLKAKVAEIDKIADAILGHKTWMILDDCAYLVTDRLPRQIAVIE